VLTISGAVQLWMVYAIALAFGIVTVVDNPARQTFVLQLSGPESLANAITLNSVNVNAARVVGPAIAAAVIAFAGVGPCFLINAASYVFIVVALFLMHTSEFFPKPNAPRAKGQVREGIQYVRHHPTLRTGLVMMALVGTFTYEFQVILPIMAKYTFGGSAGTYGVMTGAMGFGAVFGGLATAHRSHASLANLAWISAVFGVLVLGVAISPTLPVAVAALTVVGAVSIVYLARANTLLQLTAEPAMRGRVMALWTVAFLGSTPIGGPIIGFIGEHAGARWGLAMGATASLLAAAYGFAELRLGHTVEEPMPAFTTAA
jgi:MFS family permease